MLEVQPRAGLVDPYPLFELTQAVVAARATADIYDAALRCLRQSLDAQRSSILLFDAGGVMRFEAWRGLSPGYRNAVDGHSPWTRETRKPQPVLVPDIRLDKDLAPLRPVIEAEGIRALAFIPLTIGDRLLGKFMLSSGEPHEFPSAEIMVAQTIAAQVAFAIDQRRAREDRATAERERRKQRGHLDAMFRSTHAGMAEVDLAGRFLTVNDRFGELTGREAAELLAGLDCYDVTHPDHHAAARDAMQSLVNGAANVTIEKRLQRPDGETIWASSSVSAIRDDDDNLTGAVIVLVDITDRREAEDRLRDSELRYRTLIEGLDLAVYTTDADGNITLFNEAAVRLWGRRPELGTDKWCGSWRLFNPDGTPMAHEDCPMGIALRENRAVRGEEILVERPDGTRATIMPLPTPLRDSHGLLVGAVNVLVDVSQQKQMQDALELAVRAKDDFLGQVSHELRTPVTQIGGNAELLRRRWTELSADVQLRSIDEIQAQSVRLQRLVENMMLLSRFERGVAPQTEPHLIQRLLHERVREFRRRFPDTVVQVHVAPDLPPVETSASTIDQVVWNLLTNAQKYGPSMGPIVITGRCNGDWVEIAVLDEGEGVPEGDMEHLFEPYFRSPAVPGHTAGLGLGLSVCRRLIEAQHGEMWASRRDPTGMEFGLRFPALTDLDVAP
jgi:PAS domain S-box-containing protein